jgi:hypothetical protein
MRISRYSGSFAFLAMAVLRRLHPVWPRVVSLTLDDTRPPLFLGSYQLF